eukprot:CAMPEP_0116826538 /NCGR_PEP_ID=MMETSP0418-20121206/2582_1 /TAXON_ID=1158023 /ORGANISM="Astrosyne radiata, Strain 13vi08-1A" /LENGTH=204 /DNA_ID=CAMNT_0004455179 /DNA_START=117 /DNA_END=731 /DNA_ORIENTATION=+
MARIIPTAPTELRDLDELEGTLLLPTATAVDANTATRSVAQTAVPIGSFQYEDTSSIEREENLYYQGSTNNNASLPVAPLLPSYDNSVEQERRTEQAVSQAEVHGRIEAEREKEAIRKAARDIYAINYHADRQVEAANDVADQRKRVEVTGDQPLREDRKVEKEESTPAFLNNSYGGGYEVSEYNVMEYDTQDYNVSEYKSIYD